MVLRIVLFYGVEDFLFYGVEDLPQYMADEETMATSHLRPQSIVTGNTFLLLAFLHSSQDIIDKITHHRSLSCLVTGRVGDQNVSSDERSKMPRYSRMKATSGSISHDQATYDRAFESLLQLYSSPCLSIP